MQKKIPSIRKSNDSEKEHSFEKQFSEVSAMIFNARETTFKS